jgi:hypothetical protein
MSNQSLYKVGGLFAILAAVMYIIVGITVPTDPTRSSESPQEFYTKFSANPSFHQINHLAFGLAGLFLLAVIPAIARQTGDDKEGWVKWVSVLAYLGFGLTALKHFRALGFHVWLAKAFAEADAATLTAVSEASRMVEIAPLGFLTFGLGGIWFFTVSLFALKERRWPVLLCVLGFIAAVTYWLVVVERITGLGLLGIIAAVVGGVIAGPILLIWWGIRTLRSAEQK